MNRKTTDPAAGRPAIYIPLAFVFLFALPFAKAAEERRPDSNPIPGGIAVIPIPLSHSSRPAVKFGRKDIMVISSNDTLYAIVGLRQDILPGKYTLTVNSAPTETLKIGFKVKPLPAALSQRTVTLPENLRDLDFSAASLNPVQSQSPAGRAAGEHIQTQPELRLNQIIAAGSYIPYGKLIRDTADAAVINHPWITYITAADEAVKSPGSAAVESVYAQEESGITVVLNHGSNMKSVINNLGDTGLKPGQKLQTGDAVGAPMKIPGKNIGRVDWGLLLNGALIDPLQFLPLPGAKFE